MAKIFTRDRPKKVAMKQVKGWYFNTFFDTEINVYRDLYKGKLNVMDAI